MMEGEEVMRQDEQEAKLSLSFIYVIYLDIYI